MIKHILSCDWGNSSFRLRLLNVSDRSVLSETTEGNGIGVVYTEWMQSGLPESERISFYKNILLSQIGKLAKNSLAGTPIIISGMSSSSIGIVELPYTSIPVAITGESLNVHRILPDEKFEHEILIVSGFKTSDDVMRGEETMLLGCEVEDNDEWLIIFPGTHSKHATVRRKMLVDFKTYMTGEVFDLLSNKSILSNSVKKDESDKFSNPFEKGVKEGAEGNLLNNIFHVRTSHLFKSLTQEENYHFLSGLLIGSELKQIAGSKMKILLVCSRAFYGRYWQALRILYRDDNLQYFDADKALVGGHCILAMSILLP
jgi:2-dehydro-3-deoxygalactonokinase